MDLNHAVTWQASSQWPRIVCIDAHTAGEPLRVVVDGFPDLTKGAVLDVRRYVRDHHDHLRKMLMWEPRGHADMYGCLVMPSATADADFGVLFLHNEGYSTMCGHGIIAIVTVVLETGVMPITGSETEIRIDTPAGLVIARGHTRDGRVEKVTFTNVPSYVEGLDEYISIPGLGKVRYDLAFGGAYYAFVNAADVGLDCTPANYRALIDTGMAIKRAIAKSRTISHPTDEDLGFLYGTIFTAPATTKGVHSRNVCVFADGEVDRSPTGTGVSARAAIYHARGKIELGNWIEIESIIGSRFRVRAVSEDSFGGHDAIIPEVEGRAFITGRHEFVMDPADPMSTGFLLR